MSRKFVRTRYALGFLCNFIVGSGCLQLCKLLAVVSLLWPFQSPFADELSQSAGSLTSDLPLDLVLELPAQQMNDEGLFEQHIQGHSLFHSSFRDVRRNGRAILGPHFVNDSCGSCHVRTGRGSLILGKTGALSSMVVKIGLLARASRRSPSAVPGVGEQLQEHSLSGSRRYNTKLTWRYLPGSYPDGTSFTLRKPSVTFTIPKHPRSRIAHSLRMSPALVGLGLLEAIPLKRLEELADPSDANSDGISGRVHYVKDRSSGALAAGRFGFQATSSSLREQIGAALLLDMGITSDAAPRKTRSAELTASEIDALVTYQQLSGVPRFRNLSEPRFARGLSLFKAARCIDCHVATHQTSSSATPEILASQTIYPFSDLLLHDMGKELSETRREGAASGREWRTTPLWGLGIAEVTAQSPFGFLHDGRARTVEEAILWHGGEGAKSRDVFMHLTSEGRADLLFFLRSL